MKGRRLTRRLLFIRHGQALSNQRGLFLGRLDDPLTEKGVDEARHIATRIEAYDIQAVFSSPLRRAADTATIIFGEQGFTRDDRLVEQDYGRWDGLDFHTIQTRFADDFTAWDTGEPTIAPTNGETLAEVARRGQAFLNEVVNPYQAGETIALVGHAGLLGTLLCSLLGTPLRNLWPYRLENATLSVVEVVNNHPVLTKFNMR